MSVICMEVAMKGYKVLTQIGLAEGFSMKLGKHMRKM